MAETRPQTEAEASNIIVKKIQENAALLRKATAANNKADIKKYWDRAGELETQLRSTGLLGNIGSALSTGVTGLLTAVPDVITAGLKAVGAASPTTKDLGQRVSEFTGAATAPSSQEMAYPYRMAQGAGSAVLGGGLKGLLLGTGLGAADVGVSQATGGAVPEGVVSGTYGLAALSKGAIKGIRGMSQDRKMKAFINDLPDDEANKFKDFMLRGQGSSDPLVNASIQKLRTNPKYAELLSSLEEGATKAATVGMTPAGKALTTEQDTTAGIVTRLESVFTGLKQKRAEAGNSAFEVAKKYGGDREIIDPANTLQRVRSLKAEYAKKATPNAEKAVEFLTGIENNLTQGIVPKSIGVLGEPVVPVALPKMTVEKTQALLSEFGKKATTGDSLVKDLALSDEQRISATIFGGLKDDLKEARLAAKTPEDKAATGVLLQARQQIEKASNDYLDKTAQGLPKFLQNKSLRDVDYDTLYNEYKNLSPANRATMRQYVEGTDKEALNFIDKNVYKDFIDSARGKNLSGLEGTNLEKLSSNWFSLSKNEKDALTTALGTNADEFNQRMKDAQLFNRKMQVNLKAPEPLIESNAQRATAASVGAVAGYGAAKGAELTMDALNLIKKTGLNDDQLAKALLTPEGASFLKGAAMSKSANKTLEELTKLTSTQPSPESLSALTRLVPSTPTTTAPAQPTEAPSGFVMPPNLMEGLDEEQPQTQEPSSSGFVLPSNLMEGFRSAGEEKAAQAVASMDTGAPQAMQNDAVAGIRQALQSGQLQGAQAAEAQALLTKLGL